MTDRPVSVLHLIDSLGGGGAERSLVELAPRLVDHGITSRIAVLHDRPGAPGTPGDAAVAAGIPIDVVAGNPAARVAGVRRLLRRHRPDVLHTTLFAADVMGRLAALGVDVAVLTSVVNTGYGPERLAIDPNLRRSRLRAAQLLDAATIRRADGVHAISDSVAASATRRLRVPRARITTIPRGRDLARLLTDDPGAGPRVREELGIADDAPVLLHLAREEFQKAHLVLLDAVDALVRAGRPLVLLLAGARGNASRAVDERLAASPALAAAVRRPGFRTDVAALLAAADVGVVPSAFEGFSGAVLEARCVGLPVVASDIGPHRELAGPGTTTFAAGDADALAGRLTAVLDDLPVVRAAARDAAPGVRDRYDLGAVVAAHARLYRDLVAR